MQGGIRRRLTAFAVVAMSAAMYGGTAGTALAADGDAMLDQCFTPAAVGTCVAGGQASTGTIAVHPNQQWVYVASRAAGAPRISIFNRGPRGQLTPRTGPLSCVTPTGSACQNAARLGAVSDMAFDKDGKNLYASGDNGSLINFKVNADGSLSMLQCVGTATSVAAPCNVVVGAAAMGGVAIDQLTGTSAYVRVANGLLVFTRDPSTGVLTQKPTGAGGGPGCWSENGAVALCKSAAGLFGISFQIALAEDGGALYVPTSFSVTSSGVAVGGVAAFQRQGDGTLLQLGGPSGGCYTSNGTSNAAGVAGRCATISTFAPALPLATSALIDPSGTHVYVGGASGLTAFARNRGTAELTQVECYTENANSGACLGRRGARARHMVMIGPGELVTADPTSARIGFLQRDGGSGKLFQRPTLPCFGSAATNGCTALAQMGGDSDVDVSSNGLNVYSAQGTPGATITLQRDFKPVCQPANVTVPGNTAVQVGFNCSDVNGDKLTYDTPVLPAKGTLAAIDQPSGSVFYNPFSNFGGTDTFTFTATGRGVTSDVQTATMNVTAVNPGPPAGGVDADHDGWPVGQDCNDGDAAIHPTAIEIKGNRIDENCDTIAEPFLTLTSGVVTNWDVDGSRFTLKELKVTQVFPKGWSVKILCSGKPKCPFRSKNLKAGKVARSASNVIRSLKAKQRRFRAGQTVEVWVSAPNFNTKVARLVLKRNKIPTTQPFCVLPGQTKPQKTCS